MIYNFINNLEGHVYNTQITSVLAIKYTRLVEGNWWKQISDSTIGNNH